MKRNKFSVSHNLFLKKVPFPKNYKDSNLYEDFLQDNFEKNKDIKIGKEIKQKKYIISNLFKTKLGPNFLSVKPDNVIFFQKLFGKYLFDPDSQFLANFPKLQKKIRNEKKISEIKLKNKIDMGEMIFYDLGQKDKKRNRYSLMGKEKMLTISKNFSSTPAKDLVQAGFYKTKFWDKNSENIKKYFKKNTINQMNINNYIKEENDEDFGVNSSNFIDESNEIKSEDKSSINNSMINDFKEKQVENMKFVSSRDKISNEEKNNENIISDIKKTEKSKNKMNTKYISSYKNGNHFTNLKNLKYQSRNIPNSSNLFGNTLKNLSYNNNTFSKLNESNNNNSNFLKTATNFNRNNSKGFLLKSNKYFPGRFAQKKRITSLKNKNCKLKFKLGDHISQLNQYTNKCNVELIKLIDINNDDNYKERKKKLLNKNKIDMKNILYEKKEESNTDSDDEEKSRETQIEKPKEIEKESIRGILVNARNDMKEKFSGNFERKSRKKLLEKKINHLSDEQALEMVDDITKIENEILDIRKILGKNPKLIIKKQREAKNMRIKTKKNYNKMVRLKNQLIIEKSKLFKEPDIIDFNNNS